MNILTYSHIYTKKFRHELLRRMCPVKNGACLLKDFLISVILTKVFSTLLLA